MKIKKFRVDVYDWDVTLLEIESDKDWGALKRELIKFNVVKKDLVEIKNKVKTMYNGGDHYYKLTKKESILILYEMTSRKERLNCLCHEKRHLEDRILEYSGVNSIEAAGYLAGFLAKKLI